MVKVGDSKDSEESATKTSSENPKLKTLNDMPAASSIPFLNENVMIDESFDLTHREKSNLTIFRGAGNTKAYNNWSDTLFYDHVAGDGSHHSNKDVIFVNSQLEDQIGADSKNIISAGSSIGDNAFKGAFNYHSIQSKHGDRLAHNSQYVTLLNSRLGDRGLEDTLFADVSNDAQFYGELSNRNNIGDDVLRGAGYSILRMQNIGKEAGHHAHDVIVAGGRIEEGAWYDATRIAVFNMNGDLGKFYMPNEGLIIAKKFNGIMDSGSESSNVALLSPNNSDHKGVTTITSNELEAIGDELPKAMKKLSFSGTDLYNDRKKDPLEDMKEKFSIIYKEVHKTVYSIVQDKLTDSDKKYFNAVLK